MLGDHRHGKANVRVARRNHCAVTNKDEFVEYVCKAELGGHNGAQGSDKSFLTGDNCGVVATDTIKNHAYIAAKEVDWETFSTPELFAVAYAEHFLKSYEFLPYTEVTVTQVPWDRLVVNSTNHSHAFQPASRNIRWTATAKCQRGGKTEVTSGVHGMVLLKTTKSAFSGFHSSKYRTLGDTHERMVASEISAKWEYVKSGIALRQLPFKKIREDVHKSMVDVFAGDPEVGTLSNSVQHTCFQMAQECLRVRKEIKQMNLFLPNIHYVPAPSLAKTGLYKFENDVFLPTDDPFGTITATVNRETKAKL